MAEITLPTSTNPEAVVTGVSSDLGEKVDSSAGLGVLTVSDIANLLNIRVQGESKLEGPTGVVLLDLENVQLELPCVIEEIKPVLSFHGNAVDDWCVVTEKWEHATTPFSDRDGFLIRMRHTCEKLLKDLYCLYQIKEDYVSETITCMDPLKVGYDKTLFSDSNNRVLGAFETVKGTFKVTPVDHLCGTFRRVMPKSLIALSREVQDYLMTKVNVERYWLERFCVRKELRVYLPHGLPKPEPHTVLVNSSDPARINEFLRMIPDYNDVSVVYSLPFLFPVIELGTVDMKPITANAKVSLTGVSGMNTVYSMQPTSSNRDDMNRLYCAMMLPGQIMINPIFDPTDSRDVTFVAALASKLFCSYSNGCRNITPNGANTVDFVIAEYLETQGYRKPINNELGLSGISLPNRKGGSAVEWRALATLESGRGWVNDDVSPFYNIPAPLYKHVARLPQYGGCRDYSNVDRLDPDYDQVSPPIFDKIMMALSSANNRWAQPMKNLFQDLRKKYILTLCRINEHIRVSGEVGFRFSDDDVDVISLFFNSCKPAVGRNSSPIVVDISAKTFIYMLKMPLDRISMNAAVLRQPVIESQISSELQILFAAYALMYDLQSIDGLRGAKKDRDIMKLVMDSTVSNHYSLAIMRKCLADGDLGKVDWKKIRSVSIDKFDTVEARFMIAAMRAVLEDPELFGITQMVVRHEGTIHGPSQEDFDKIPRPAIFASTSLSKDNLRIIPRKVFDDWLLKGVVIRNCKQTEYDGKAILPIWYEYEEKVVGVWEAEKPCLIIRIDKGHSSDGAIGESYTVGKFTNQFLVPQGNELRPYFPDELYLSSSYRTFWYVGSSTHTFDFRSDIVFGDKRQYVVRNWKSSTKFRHALVVS